jgi:energy-converting hydrogenase A subunit M
LEKPVTNNDFSVMDENLINKDMEDMIISYNSPKSIFKDYLEVSLYLKVEVLEVIDDNKVKLEKKSVKKLQVDFIGAESRTLNMEFPLKCAYKLDFEVHRSRTCYFVKMLATMLYSKYLFALSGRVQFLKIT